MGRPDKVRQRRRATRDGYLRMLLERGQLIAPSEISWRRAEQLKASGYVMIHLFHNRWQGRVEPTQFARDSFPLPLRTPHER